MLMSRMEFGRFGQVSVGVHNDFPDAFLAADEYRLLTKAYLHGRTVTSQGCTQYWTLVLGLNRHLVGGCSRGDNDLVGGR